jgi:hypothetical protein
VAEITGKKYKWGRKKFGGADFSPDFLKRTEKGLKFFLYMIKC